MAASRQRTITLSRADTTPALLLPRPSAQPHSWYRGVGRASEGDLTTKEGLQRMETSAPHTPHWGAPAARWGEKPWVKLLPQRVSCRNQRLEPAEPEWPGECAWGQGLHAKQRTRSWGGSQVWGGGGAGLGGEREEGEGLSTGEAGWRQGLGPSRRWTPPPAPGAGEGPEPCPAHPPTRLWQDWQHAGPGQPRGQDLPSNRPAPHFPQPTHPHGWASLFPQPCQALASLHQADFWGAQTLC